MGTIPYIREGTEKFLAEFGPAQYHSADGIPEGGWVAIAPNDYRRKGSGRAEGPASR